MVSALVIPAVALRTSYLRPAEVEQQPTEQTSGSTITGSCGKSSSTSLSGRRVSSSVSTSPCISHMRHTTAQVVRAVCGQLSAACMPTGGHTEHTEQTGAPPCDTGEQAAVVPGSAAPRPTPTGSISGRHPQAPYQAYRQRGPSCGARSDSHLTTVTVAE